LVIILVVGKESHVMITQHQWFYLTRYFQVTKPRDFISSRKWSFWFHARGTSDDEESKRA
jgi:hypothetical protein